MFKGLGRKSITNCLFLNILIVIKLLKNQDLVTARRYVLPFVVDWMTDP